MLSRSALWHQHKGRFSCVPRAAVAANMAQTSRTAVHKPLCDRRKYQYAQLKNGVRVLVVQDVDAMYAAASANVQCGYFDDPIPGAAHFVEHMVHLGSDKFPDEKEYKSFLGKHGGTSNASTSMVHTRYHFKVHSNALPGALQRFGAMLSCPIISQDSSAREVENVHAEYSRNTNSDARKLLQLRRSLCEAPYSNFSTGSLSTLWEQPQQQGLDVPGVLKDLWQRFYRAEATCVAVVGPQEPETLLQWVEEAFADMPSSSSSSSDTSITAPLTDQLPADAAPEGGCFVLGQHRYPCDVVGAGSGGRLLLISPQRDLRELEMSWHLPRGVMMHSSTKPWQWASHLLGHEGPGSVAHLLKAQGLVQSLEVGMGEEVRLGRGWMFWRVQVSLTQAGEEAVDDVVASVFRAIQVMQRCTDEQLQQTWQEAASLAELRFNWRDPTEPLAAAQSAAYALHYYPAAQTLSGPHLMTEYDPSVLRWFVDQLTPANMNVFWSSRRHAGVVDCREQWYGAAYAVQPLPQGWVQRIAHYWAVDAAAGGSTTSNVGVNGGSGSSSGCIGPGGDLKQQQQLVLQPVPGELHLPEANWALPQDFALRFEEGEDPAAAAVYVGAATPPTVLLEQPGLCVWHRKDVSYGLPKVHLRLHLVTPAVYATPDATVSTRLLLRVLEDMLLPLTYPAELAGSSCSLSSDQGGLFLKLVGFPGVVQQLLHLVLQGIIGLTPQQVQERFATMSGRLQQGLTNWASNNPAQHAEYAAHHLLQQHHHHNTQLLAAAAAAAPEHLLALQQQLLTGRDLHIDALAYGNISRQEANALVSQLQQQLKPQGLPPGVWPPAGRVLCLSPVSTTAAAAAGGGERFLASTNEQQQQALQEEPAAARAAAAAAAGGAVYVTYLPHNPNPSNSNSAIYYTVQLGPDTISTAVLLDLFVQMSSKAAFYELRTRQRLGYSVSLSSSSTHRQLGLMIRVQSPSTTPDVLAAAVRVWLAGFRAELEGMAAEQLPNQKQALRDKYLDPLKSLHEASRRTWGPIQSRTLVFDRRRQKAAAAEALSQQQLLEFYDTFLYPDAPQHRALCVQVWGGHKAAAGKAAEGRQVAGAGEAAAQLPARQVEPGLPAGGTSGLKVLVKQQQQHVTVLAHDVDVFKQCQPLMPMAELQLPPPAAAAGAAHGTLQSAL